MDCRRAEELLSDHLEGALHAILRAELEAHLARCADCRALREALDEVVVALHTAPDLAAPSGLAERAAAAAMARPHAVVVKVLAASRAIVCRHQPERAPWAASSRK